MDEHVVQRKIRHGETPYIDHRWKTRSFAEAKLVEITERCFEYNPAKRIDIFNMVRFLRHAVEENRRVHVTQQLVHKTN